ncbi:MAG: class I SAM-dependent methyltransferase [Planctomycetota bacterium]|nr:hypothetical protein [Planctomycetaceae bacterium]MDQ3331112.1 class I SAM-dependent methyltransferase [Planctomycetota bacterium]
MAGEGEKRCHGTCQAAPRPVDKIAQAWGAVARPQTNCYASQHHPQQFGPTPEQHALRIAHELAHFEALQLVTDPATNQSELRPLQLVVDDSLRDEYRKIATSFELAISRIFVLYGSSKSLGVDSAGKSYERVLTGPATPILSSAGIVVAYTRFQESGGFFRLYVLDVEGQILSEQLAGESPLEDSIGNDLVAILATAGVGAYIKMLSRASAAAIAGGGTRAVLSRVGVLISASASVVAKKIGNAALKRLLNTGVGKALLGRLLTASEQAAADGLRQTALSLVKQLRAAGKRVVMNIGGTGEVADAINVNPNVVAPRNDIPNLVKTEAEKIGEFFEANSVDEIVSNRLPPNTLDWDQVIPNAHRVLKPNARIVIKFQGVGQDGAIIEAALKRMKFRDIKNFSGGVFEAVK